MTLISAITDKKIWWWAATSAYFSLIYCLLGFLSVTLIDGTLEDSNNLAQKSIIYIHKYIYISVGSTYAIRILIMCFEKKTNLTFSFVNKGVVCWYLAYMFFFSSLVFFFSSFQWRSRTNDNNHRFKFILKLNMYFLFFNIHRFVVWQKKITVKINQSSTWNEDK
jgi:hypothetical protein